MSKLPYAPLNEVIFEIRWPLQMTDQGYMVDEGFELASGRLSILVEEDFPINRRVKSAELPEQFFPYQVIHQYWKGEQKWPVLQLGPGIFTINYTDKVYYWEDMLNLIKKGIKWLMQAYREKVNIDFASLNYIDIIETEKYGGVDSDWSSFIAKNLNVTHENNFPIPGKQNHIQINQMFAMDDGSNIRIQISDGSKNNKEALVWQTAVVKKHDFSKVTDLFEWAEFAHDTTHTLFMEMVKPDLYASFENEN